MGVLITVGLLALITVSRPTIALAEQPLAAENVPCRFWDQYPDPRKSIRWSGDCEDGWTSGPGILEWFYDRRYDGRVEGTFKEGRLEGQAEVTWRDGRRLRGTFRRGLVSGHGIHIWPDGRVYDGEWQDDRRTGFGTLIFPDGTRYVGHFHRNRPTGRGEFVTADGRRFQARLEANGRVRAGAPLDQPPQSAAVPPVEGEGAQDGRLEDWLKKGSPIIRPGPD